MDNESAHYLKIAVDVPVDSAEICPSAEFQTFDYRVPPDSPATVGSVLEVPFGRRRVLGFALESTENPAVDPAGIRDVGEVLWDRPFFGPEEMELARWIAKRYLCRPLDALKLMLPPGIGDGGSPFPRAPRLLMPHPSWRQRLPELDRAPAQREIMETVDAYSDGISRADLARATGRSPSVIDALVDKGFLRWHRVDETYLPGDAANSPGQPHDLTSFQGDALAEVLTSLDGNGGPVLLHGVTGSGKTEVYLRAVTRVLERGGGALILVPEISLTPQMIERVRDRLDVEVALLHSALSASERARSWRDLKTGRIRVALGPRSVIFAPCPDLQLIVLDEEHETSYKQDVNPRYHAREVAMARARLTGATVILGSATPSLETYHWARTGRYISLRLPKRVAGGDPPLPRLVDMREERKAGNRSLFSRDLHAAMQRSLGRGEQTVLFLNQRGYSAFIMCPDCGTTLRCIHCSVTMTYHRGDGLHCHYCGDRSEPPSRCPKCGGHQLLRRGLGTQKVEAAVLSAFPGARVRRMDTDSVRHRGVREEIYHAFAAGEIDVLVGTQMIAKGWDIPSVGVVGIVDADTALHLPDFRGAERTFQLITQVSGRTGRGSIPGEVVVQTWSPEHPALEAARLSDLEGFYARELDLRRDASYPPFTALLRGIVRGKDADAVARVAQELATRLRPLEAEDPPAAILGPTPAPLERIRGEYRHHLFVKFPGDLVPGDRVRSLLQGFRRRESDPRVALDVDPVSMM